MTAKVLFFAHLRDIAQADSFDIELGSATVVRDLLQQLRGQVPDELIEAIADESALVSVNHKYAGWDGVIKDGDEIGILPPVSGG